MTETENSLRKIEAALGIKGEGYPVATEMERQALLDLLERRTVLEKERESLETEHADVSGAEQGPELLQAREIAWACAHTLRKAAKVKDIDRESSKKFSRLADLCDAYLKEPSFDLVVAKKLAIAAVGLIDVLENDGIAKTDPGYITNANYEFRARYLRDEEEKNIYAGYLYKESAPWNDPSVGRSRLLMFHRGEEAIFNRQLKAALRKQPLKEGEKKTPVKTAKTKEDLLALFNQEHKEPVLFYLDGVITADEMIAVKNAFSESPFVRRNALYTGVRFNENVSAHFFLAGDDSGPMWDRFKTPTEMGEIRSILPRQDRWLALLENGIVPPVDYAPQEGLFYEPRKGVAPSKERKPGRRLPSPLPDVDDLMKVMLSHGPLSRWRRYLKRKMDAFLKSSEHADVLERYLARHERHYKKFFSRGGQEPEVAFTRGGFSANEVAIKAALRSLKEDERTAFMMPGWYYENEESVESNFEVVRSVKAAQLLCVNSSPNGIIKKERAASYGRDRERYIADFIENAAAHPDKRYFLVVDKTTDLLYEAFPSAKDLPPNVTVFEAMSLTKHQRGGQNYFFGALACWGKQPPAGVIDKVTQETRGGLSALSLVNLPRLRRSEVLKNTEHLDELRQVFQQAFEESQLVLPSEYRWALQSNTFSTALIPPFESLSKITRDGDELRRLTGEDLYFTLEGSARLAFQRIGVEMGDSFGLDATRYTTLPSNMLNRPLRLKNMSEKDDKGHFKYPRFSFGSRFTKEQARDLGQSLGTLFAERLKTELETRGVHV